MDDTDIKNIKYKPTFFDDTDTRKSIIMRIEILQNLYTNDNKMYLENCAVPFQVDNLKVISRNENEIVIKCYLE